MNANSKGRASRLSDARLSERTVAQAARATAAWDVAVGGQRVLRLPDHEGFYALAGEVVGTLRRLDEMCELLTVQVAAYGHTATAVGGVLRDDEPGHDPAERIAIASSWAAQAGHLIRQAHQAAGTFWSEIGHVAIDQPATDGGDAGEVTR